jgi:hypothetical protein
MLLTSSESWFDNFCRWRKHILAGVKLGLRAGRPDSRSAFSGGTVTRSSILDRVLSSAARFPRLATRNGVCKLRIWISSTDVVGTLAQSALVALGFFRTIRFCTAAKSGLQVFERICNFLDRKVVASHCGGEIWNAQYPASDLESVPSVQPYIHRGGPRPGEKVTRIELIVPTTPLRNAVPTSEESGGR